MISKAAGEFLVKLVKDVIAAELREEMIIIPPEYPKELDQKAGVFVTLYKRVGGYRNLNGCIGLPYPDKPLIDGCVQAALSALRDERFSPLMARDLDKLEVEVSVLSPPERIAAKSPEEYPERIRLGTDGLIIKKGVMSGLFLPQVPVEQHWSAIQYLENLCEKAGMNRNTWKDRAAELYRFTTQTFT
ncbi:MAG: TIGR00296 family protein [Candidatus Aenigmatarchaeota archaeon]